MKSTHDYIGEWKAARKRLRRATRANNGTRERGKVASDAWAALERCWLAAFERVRGYPYAAHAKYPSVRAMFTDPRALSWVARPLTTVVDGFVLVR